MIGCTIPMPDSTHVRLVRKHAIDTWDGTPIGGVEHVVLEHEVGMHKLRQTGTCWAVCMGVKPLLERMRLMFPDARRGWYGCFPWPHWVSVHGVVGPNPVQPYSRRLDLATDAEIDKTVAACEMVANLMRDHLDWWCPSIYAAYANLDGCLEVARAQVSRMASIVGAGNVLPFTTHEMLDSNRRTVDLMSPDTFRMYQAEPAILGCGSAVLWSGLPWYADIACRKLDADPKVSEKQMLSRTLVRDQWPGEAPEIGDEERWADPSTRLAMNFASAASIRRRVWVLADVASGTNIGASSAPPQLGGT